MTFIMSILLPLRLAMLLLGLRQRDEGLGKNGCKNSVDCNRFEFRHFFTLLQSQSNYPRSDAHPGARGFPQCARLMGGPYTIDMNFPVTRLRRLRRTESMRS